MEFSPRSVSADQNFIHSSSSYILYFMSSSGNLITNYYLGDHRELDNCSNSISLLSPDRLSEKGLALADVASISVALRDMSDYAAVNGEYIKNFSSPNPPSREEETSVKLLFAVDSPRRVRNFNISRNLQSDAMKVDLSAGRAWRRKIPYLW